ncbi:MAG: heparinase II/III domain-containing protein, partial [Puniceicoccales bacterium]
MINPIDTPTSRETLIQIFSESPPVSLLPELHSGRWSTALSNPRIAKELSLLMEKADAESAVPLPPLTDKAYREFAATGMRLPFERIYFERRRRLARAAVALLAEPDSESRKGSFLEKLEDIFSEPSWTLPAHVRNETGRDPFQIGLFSAETANLMGECYNVFGAILPQEFKDRIQQRIRQQFLENYLDPQREPGWTSIQNNWNAVCHQGVLGAALSIVDDPELLADLLIKASRSLPLFLEGYGPDGGCSEGPSYWEYGFGWFAVLNEQL